MGTTLNKLREAMKDLHVDGLAGANVLLKGIKTLAEHINSPWGELIKEIFPPAHLLIGLLKAIQAEKRSLDLDSCAALAIQHAYLEVFQNNLNEEKGNLEARFDLDDVEVDEQWKSEFSRTVETLQEFDIDVNHMDFPNLHNEPLVKEHFEKIAAEWLKVRLFKQDFEACEAVNFARRISYQLYPQILRIVSEYSDTYAPLAQYLEKVDHRELRELRDIEKYRAYLMKLPLKPIFNETFALKDMYAELDATDITPSSKRKGKTAQLMQAVVDQLDDKEHVVFIQAGPGKGKSVFCQMLAAKVATQMLDWIPVLVRLRDDRFSAEQRFEKSIREYIKTHFTLTDELLRTRRFFFILDGFDELWLSSESSYVLKFFFARLSAFQKECSEENRWNHKILVTGRPMRIQDIESELPVNFLRLKIENMRISQFKAWLNNWAVLFGAEVAKDFTVFLTQGKVFDETKESHRSGLKSLASEPLLLYMLGAMHRDGALSQDSFDTARRIAIYDKAISWVCGDTKSGKYKTVHRGNRVLERSGIQPYELRQLLQETALCIWQGGGEFAPIERIKKRLNDVVPKQTKKLFGPGLEGVHNLLASFYFQRHKGESGNVEFSHKSFGEYLVAEKMAETLIDIGECSVNRNTHQEEYRIKDAKDVANLFYSVFSAMRLSHEVRDFIMDFLSKHQTEKEIKHITERLYEFYIAYSDGRWMSEGISRARWDELRKYESELSLLEFEASVGVNLFALLCVLYQKTEDEFSACGREENGSFDEYRINRLWGIGEIAKPPGLLWIRIYRFLKKIDLHGARLRERSFYGADLRKANLQRADLRGANFQGADLENADLENADLRGANLENANLVGANLSGVNFQSRELNYAILYTDLTNAKILKHDLEKYRHLFSEEQIAQLNVCDE